MGDVLKQKRVVMPFFDRADQVEALVPIVAYHTRYAGVMKGVALPERHTDIEQVLLLMMEKLEASKKELGIASEKDMDKRLEEEQELQAFALNVFKKADQADQLGVRDKKLLDRYMASRTFMQALEVFKGGLDPKEQEILKYIETRAFNISRALKSGEDIPAPPVDAGPPPNDAIDVEAELQRLPDTPPSPRPPPPPAPAVGGQHPGGETLSGYEAEESSAYPSEDGAGYRSPPVPPPRQPSPPPALNSLDALPQAPQQIPSYFAAGAHVLFKENPSAAPEPGRIVATTSNNARITLTSRVTEASAAQLAPYLPSGSEAVLRPGVAAAQPLSVLVTGDNSGSGAWPPQYDVTTSHGQSLTVSHWDFLALTLPPSAQAPPRVQKSAVQQSTSMEALPSVPANLPGVPDRNFGYSSGAPPPLPTSPPPQSTNNHAEPPQYHQQQQQRYPHQSAAPPPQPKTPPPESRGGYGSSAAPRTASGPVTIQRKEAAKKYAKQAISSLNFDDTQSAVDLLHKALAELGAS